MFRPDPLSPLSPEALAARMFVSRPAAAATGTGGATYRVVVDPVASEVHRLIDEGWGDDAAPLASSPEARWRALQATRDGAPLGAAQQAFLERIAPWARQAAAALGVAPELVQAHAALESGWGLRPLAAANGADANNPFGVKAGAGWDGDVVHAATTEFEDGVAQSRQAPFRRYADLGEAFGDYVRLLGGQARYRAALNRGSDAQAFARGLVQGGYATDPQYARKLVEVASRVIPAKAGTHEPLAAPRGSRLSPG
jgi:flagellar protein FlgJ